MDHAATDCAIAAGVETTVDIAATKTRNALAGSALLLAAAAITTAHTADHAISPLVVVLMAAVVAGEQLWGRRRHIPSQVPVTLVDRDDDALTPVIPVAGALFIATVLAVFVVVGELFPSFSAAALGPFAGYAVRDLVMTIRVARWQRRHDHVIAWVGSGDELESRILL